ncbi:MAG: DUF2934 domain-containing protein [Isosphaeraceae bacterium]
MFPSLDQIERLAYDRWEERGYAHGHDAEDWLAAEQDLLFTLNYEVIARYRLDGIAPEVIGSSRNRRCRFCEQGAPRASFSAPGPVVPECLGASTLLTMDECDDCRALFLESIEPALERFATPWRTGQFPGEGAPASIPIAAYKGLVKLALLALPETELPYVEDALEWVGNPDHDLDGRAFQSLTCHVGFCSNPAPFASMALARRIDDEAAVPYLLGFLVTGRATFQIQIPLCVRDEDLDGPDPVMPQVANPPGGRRRPGERVGVVCPLAPVATRQGRRAMANGLPW